jgi:hypothetical protein
VVDVEDDHPLRDADLGGREPDAGCRVHGLDHVVDGLGDRAVDVRDVVRDLFQRRLGIRVNPPNHGVFITC